MLFMSLITFALVITFSLLIAAIGNIARLEEELKELQNRISHTDDHVILLFAKVRELEG